MKILQICAAYKPAFIYGGPTMSVSMLSEELSKARVFVTVFTTTANGKTELPVAHGQPINVDGVTVWYFKRVTKDHSHFSPALLKKFWKDARGFDLVHIHTWWNLVSVLSCLIALLRNVPVMFSARGTLSPYSFKNKNAWVKLIIHRLFGKPLLNRCHVHVTSAREKEAIIKLIRPKSIAILPNFVKLSAQELENNYVPAPYFRLLFFSRIEEKKGLDILLNALPMLTTPYYLTIAGDGDKNYVETLKAIAISNDTDDKINWIGFQGENKYQVLQEHDLFVLPSYDENFGNTVIESLSVGTPVLISEDVGLADYVKKNNLGWICKTNPESVSDQINKIASNSQANLARIRENAPGIIEKDFNEVNLVRRYINMYDQLVKQ